MFARLLELASTAWPRIQCLDKKPRQRLASFMRPHNPMMVAAPSPQTDEGCSHAVRCDEGRFPIGAELLCPAWTRTLLSSDLM